MKAKAYSQSKDLQVKNTCKGENTQLVHQGIEALQLDDINLLLQALYGHIFLLSSLFFSLYF